MKKQSFRAHHVTMTTTEQGTVGQSRREMGDKREATLISLSRQSALNENEHYACKRVYRQRESQKQRDDVISCSCLTSSAVRRFRASNSDDGTSLTRR